jgi:hypothetical protein
MIAVCLSLLLGLSADPLECDVVVVCPEVCDQAITPWIKHRESQGHRICLLRPADRETLKTTLTRLANEGQLKHIVLIGDAPDSNTSADSPLGPMEIPTCYVKAEVNVKFGSEPWIASDAPYADINEDGAPDLSIGRIAVDSPEEVATVLQKVIQYESPESESAWRRKINLIAGVGGFGSVADSVLEMSTKRFIVDGIPPAYEASMTYGSWQSPYCPSPPDFRKETIGRLNDGCLMWVYIGHGMPGYVAPVRTPKKLYPVLDIYDMEQLESKSGSPIAIFFACYTAAFDFNQRGDCLAEEMLIQQKGPVAVLGASRVSMPYAMAVLSNEMLKEYFGRKHQTLGEMIAGAKRASLATQNEAEDKNRVLLDTLAATLSPTRELLDKERLENLALFNLIGDPLLRLNYPQELQLETEPVVESGSKIQIQGEAPSDGKLVLEISYRRDRTLKPYDKRKEYRGDVQQLDEFRQTYAEANLRQVATEAFTVKKGHFEVELEVPVWAIGAAYVRGFVESPEGFALGGHEIRIRRPSSTSP